MSSFAYELEKLLDEMVDAHLTDREIIQNYGKDEEAIAREMKNYHDSLMETCRNNDLPLDNKMNFILALCSKLEYKEELLSVLFNFIQNDDYIFEIKDNKIRPNSRSSWANYIQFKNRIDEFEEKWKFICSAEKSYDTLKKLVCKKETKSGEQISNTDKKTLADLYYENVQQEKIIDENIEYIHCFCTQNNERKKIYPYLMFRIMINYRKKICKDYSEEMKNPNFINPESLFVYQNYNIEEDNGKNFKQHSKYINLFLRLCEEFSHVSDVELCKYLFEKLLNLNKWGIERTEEQVFSHSIYSLVKSRSGFLYWGESNFDGDIIDHISDEELMAIQVELIMYFDENKFFVTEYMEKMKTGRKYGLNYIENVAIHIRNVIDVDESLEIEVLEFLIECELRDRVDEKVETYITRFMEEVR
ncbi:hypothetical protein [Bacillus cereus]|uniref:hypothetical protein n=1 Tax=Bacillus cereus TaxID=1396 RepID=UPI003EE39F32